MKLPEQIEDKIHKFLSELHTEVDVVYYVDIEDIDLDSAEDAYRSIYDMIESNDGFSGEIIYYSNAINYLAKNDPSLRESLSLADDMGYSPGNLDSEILASILHSNTITVEFEELRDDIIYFFEEIIEELEELENQEEEEEED